MKCNLRNRRKLKSKVVYQINQQKLKKYMLLISNALYILFILWGILIRFKNHNYPQNDKKVIFALWHHDQLCLGGIPKNRRCDLNILISKSIDGEFVARVVEKMGFSTIRGSKNKEWKDKGGKEATFEMITKLKEGQSIAITVDGPTGPLHKVKNGVIKIAKLTKTPIIPVVWYSPSKFLGTLSTWDKLKIPLWFVKTINLYGEPIYVPEDADKEQEKQIKLKLQEELLNLEKDAKKLYKNIIKRR